MGTRASVEFYYDSQDADTIVTELQAELLRLERLLSPWIADSELARFNALPANTHMPLSPEFVHLLRESRHYWRLSKGAFDITFAGAGHLYDYRAGVAPSEDQLHETMIGMQHLTIEPDGASKAFAGIRIDLGGIAKGYAMDQAKLILTRHGIRHAWMSLGGDSIVMGARGDRPWQIGIRHPRDENAVALTLPLSDVAVSTSGDYERYFLRDGEHIHHILNPGTGRPAGELVSVTIIAPNSTMADALSTSLFVMGVEAGLALANTLDDVSAILIDQHGKVHYSDDLFSGD